MKWSKFFIIIIIFFAIISFSNILANYFVGDDFEFIFYWTTISKISLHNIQLLITGNLPPAQIGVYRPIRSLIYLIAFYLFKHQAIYYHLFAISIHVISTILVYFIVKKISQNIYLTFISTLIFTTHPIHVASISYITTSFDIIGIIFLLISFYLYLNYLDKKNYLLIISLIFANLAYFTYEITFVLPLLIITYNFIYKKNVKFRIYGLYFIGIIIYFITRFKILHLTSRNSFYDGGIIQIGITNIKAFIEYLYTLFIPIKLGFNHRLYNNIDTYSFKQFNQLAISEQTLKDPYSLMFIGILIIIILLIYKQKKHKLLLFSSLWIFIALLPVINIFPNSRIFSESYAYLTSIGYAVFISTIIIPKNLKHTGKAIIKLILITLVIIFNLHQTLNYNKAFSNNISLWTRESKINPNSTIYYQLGSSYQNIYDYKNALIYFKKSIELNPNFAISYHNLGVIYQIQKEYLLAIDNYQKAIKIGHRDIDKTYSNLGDIHLQFHRYSKAIESYNKVKNKQLINQQLISAYNNLALTYNQKRQYLQALEMLNKVIDLDPNNYQAIQNIGIVYLNLEDHNNAIKYLEKAMQIKPNQKLINQIKTLKHEL